MLKDWNFWCTVMTSIAAFIALYLSVRQIKLGNKQQLFDRRLKVYMLVNSMQRKLHVAFRKKRSRTSTN